MKDSFFLVEAPVQSVWDGVLVSAFFIVMSLGTTTLHHGKCSGDTKGL